MVPMPVQKPEEKPLSWWIERYLDHLRYQRNASPHTLRNYASDLRQFYTYLTRAPEGQQRAEPELDAIDNITIREFLGWLYQRSNRKSSVARTLATVRSFMRFFSAQVAVRATPAQMFST